MAAVACLNEIPFAFPLALEGPFIEGCLGSTRSTLELEIYILYPPIPLAFAFSSQLLININNGIPNKHTVPRPRGAGISGIRRPTGRWRI